MKSLLPMVLVLASLIGCARTIEPFWIISGLTIERASAEPNLDSERVLAPPAIMREHRAGKPMF